MDLVRLATRAMGTRFEIVLGGLDATRLRAAGEAAIEEIEEWHARLSVFDPGSFIAHVNTRAAERPVALDDEMLELLAACDDTRRRSGGVFDVAVAPLMRSWGFHPGDADVTRDAYDTCHDGDVVIDADERTVRFARAGVAIDLGGIGKGHALDRAGDVLRDADVTSALLHGGTSSVLAVGAPLERGDGDDGWRIGLAGTPAPTTVTLRDAALSVSAPHGRTVERGGRRLGHVLDPRTGAPAERATLAAVVGPSARTADAWSTALLVLGARPAAMPEAYGSLVITADGHRERTAPWPGPGAFAIDERIEEEVG